MLNLNRRVAAMQVFLKSLAKQRPSEWKESTSIAFDDAKLYLQGNGPDAHPFSDELRWEFLASVCATYIILSGFKGLICRGIRLQENAR